MQIKTRLKAVSWTAAAIAVLVVLISAWTQDQLKQSLKRHELAEEMISTAYKRSIMRAEYLLNREDRPKEQWMLLTDSLSALIKQAQAFSASPEQSLILQQIEVLPDKTKKLLTHLSENKSDMENGRISNAFGQEIEGRITTQLIIDSQTLLTHLLKLQIITDQEYITRQTLSNALILISMLILVSLTATSLFLIARSIAAPIMRLRKGFATIATGNLDHRITISGNDELAGLAQDCNQMAAELKESYTSLKNLHKEMAERRRVEDALAQSLERFQMANKATFDIIWDWNLQTNEIWWNENFMKIFGYEANEIEVSSVSWTNRIHPEERDRVCTGIHAVIDSGEEIWSDHYRFQRKDGAYADIEDRGHISRDEDGRPVRMIGAMQDVTQRKRMDNTLQESESKFKRLYDSNIIGIIFWDTDGNIREANPEFLRMVGYSQDEVLSGNVRWKDMTPPEYAYLDEKAIREMSETGVCSLFEKEYIHKNGSRVPIILGAAFLKGQKNIGICFVLDITDRKESEREILRLNTELEQRVIERTAQLEAANRELEAFAYSVSHDLRAPLRAVDGYTRILAEDYEAQLDVEGKRVCSVISQSARDMGKLIDDLLAFSSVGRATMQRSTIDMAAMAQSIFFEITTAETRERIDFHVGPLPSIVGDLSLFRQVWTNLLSNAVKFSSKKDRSKIEISSAHQDGQTYYSIRDNGAGFDMQYLDKLFGVFQRLHSTREFEGTGVGLAIAQRIIVRHGGRIWAEGEVGKGAIFYFSVGKGE